MLDENEIRAVGPERIVIVVRPEGEREDVAEKEGPKDRTGPATPAQPPIIPAGAPEAAAPAIPAAGVAERIAVKAGVTEIVQAVEILRGELIVCELRARDCRVAATELRMGGECVVRGR